MASPNANTFSLTPARRPGLDDFNGASKIDDAENPPDPATMPNAAEANTVQRTLIGVAKVVHVLVLTVDFTAGAPVVVSYGDATEKLDVGDFSLVDNAAGDTSITWPAGTFPTAIADFLLTVTADVAIDEQRAFAITNGVRVVTKNGGVATDARFTLVAF